MAESQLGKYEFYPYPKEFREPPLTLEELVELLKRAKPRARRMLSSTKIWDELRLQQPENAEEITAVREAIRFCPIEAVVEDKL